MGDFFACNASLLDTIAQRVPDALASCDAACKEGAHLSFENAIDITHTLRDIEADLDAWTRTPSRSSTNPPYHLVASTKLPFLEHSASRLSGAFQWVFLFDGLADAVDHIIYSASLLSIKGAMLDLNTVLVHHPQEWQAAKRLNSRIAAPPLIAAGQDSEAQLADHKWARANC